MLHLHGPFFSIAKGVGGLPVPGGAFYAAITTKREQSRPRCYTITVRTYMNRRKNLGRSGNSVTASVTCSRVWSYSYVVLGDSCATICWACLGPGSKAHLELRAAVMHVVE